MLSERHRRYLRLLGFRAAPAGLDGLRRLVAAHLERIPFENVSKLLLYAREGSGRPVRLAEFLDGVEHHDLGGTCYSSNPFLFELLRALGYDASLLSADMRSPDVHSSVRVRLNGRQFHIDAGYAAPFVYPIPLDDLPHTIAAGSHKYVIAAGPRTDTYQVTQFVDGQPRHGYVVHPPDRDSGFFTGAILDSYQKGRTFMRCLRVSRTLQDRTIDLQNRTLTVSRGESVSALTINDMAELRRVVDTILLMPRCPVEDAVATLERLTGTDFFGAGEWADSLA